MTISLVTLDQATEKEVFAQVATHLLRQMNRSIDKYSHNCRYRYGALMCAAGCLISDDEYRESMEGKDWARLCFTHWKTTKHASLIKELQQIHDRNYPNKWRAKLRNLAVSLNTTLPTL